MGRRSFAGNSSVVGPGRELADGALPAVLSTAPDESLPNSSWVGRPAFELPRVTETGDPARTFEPLELLGRPGRCIVPLWRGAAVGQR